MIGVLDANAAVELIDHRPFASAVEEKIISCEKIVAPDLFVHELTNVYWKNFHFGKVNETLCVEYLNKALSLPNEFVSLLNSAVDILYFSCTTGLSAYDSSYAILTKNIGGTLITLDSKLATTCEEHQISVFHPRLN